MKRTLALALLLIGFCVIANSSFAQLSNTYTIINKTGSTIKAVYYAPAGSNNWSDNISTLDKIGMNEGFQYGFDADKDHCNIDIKYVDTDGKSWTDNNISLCNASIITLRKQK